MITFILIYTYCGSCAAASFRYNATGDHSDNKNGTSTTNGSVGDIVSRNHTTDDSVDVIDSGNLTTIKLPNDITSGMLTTHEMFDDKTRVSLISTDTAYIHHDTLTDASTFDDNITSTSTTNHISGEISTGSLDITRHPTESAIVTHTTSGTRDNIVTSIWAKAGTLTSTAMYGNTASLSTPSTSRESATPSNFTTGSPTTVGNVTTNSTATDVAYSGSVQRRQNDVETTKGNGLPTRLRVMAEDFFQIYFSNSEWVLTRFTLKHPNRQRLGFGTTAEIVSPFPNVKELGMKGEAEECEWECPTIMMNYGPVCGRRVDPFTWVDHFQEFATICDMRYENCRYKRYRPEWYAVVRGGLGVSCKPLKIPFYDLVFPTDTDKVFWTRVHGYFTKDFTKETLPPRVTKKRKAGK